MTSLEREPVSIGATPTFADDEWSVRLPVRAEQISLSKQVVVRERVVVRRQSSQEHARVEARLLREELRTSKSGPVEVSAQDTESIPTNVARK